MCTHVQHTPRDVLALDMTPTAWVKVVFPTLLTQISTDLSLSDTDRKSRGYSNVTTGGEGRGGEEKEKAKEGREGTED